VETKQRVTVIVITTTTQSLTYRVTSALQLAISTTTIVVKSIPIITTVVKTEVVTNYIPVTSTVVEVVKGTEVL